MYGNLPSESQLADWEFAVSQHSAVPQGVLVCLWISKRLSLQFISSLQPLLLQSKACRNFVLADGDIDNYDSVMQDIIQAMPHDAHPMGVLVSAMSALSVFHPDANPALRVSKWFHKNKSLLFSISWNFLIKLCLEIFVLSFEILSKVSLHFSMIMSI